jgi:hypothetical protein
VKRLDDRNQHSQTSSGSIIQLWLRVFITDPLWNLTRSEIFINENWYSVEACENSCKIRLFDFYVMKMNWLADTSSVNQFHWNHLKDSRLNSKFSKLIEKTKKSQKTQSALLEISTTHRYSYCFTASRLKKNQFKVSRFQQNIFGVATFMLYYWRDERF